MHVVFEEALVSKSEAKKRAWWTAHCTCGWWAGTWWLDHAKAERARKIHQKEHPPWVYANENKVPRPPYVTTPTCDSSERPQEPPKPLVLPGRTP